MPRQNNNVVPTRSSARISNAKAASAATATAAAAAAAASKPAQSPKAQRQARRRRDARKAKTGTAPGKEIRPSVKAVPKSAPATNKRKRADDEDGDESKGGDVPASKKSRGQGKTAIRRKTTSAATATATATTTLGGSATTRAAAEPALRRVVLKVKKPALEIRLNVSPPLPAGPVSRRRKAANTRRSSVKKAAVGLTPSDLRRRSEPEVAAQKNSRAERLKSLRAKRAARVSTT